VQEGSPFTKTSVCFPQRPVFTLVEVSEDTGHHPVRQSHHGLHFDSWAPRPA